MADDGDDGQVADSPDDGRLPVLVRALEQVREEDERLVDLVDKLRAFIQPPRRLSPLEQDLYRVPDVAFDALVHELVDPTSADWEDFRSAESKLDRVVWMRRFAERTPANQREVMAYAYAARTSVKEVVADKALTRDAVVAAVQKARQVDLSGEGGVDVATALPRPSHVQDLPGGQFAMIYVWSNSRARPVLQPDGTLYEPQKRTQVAVLVDPAAGRVQARGAAGDLETALAQFQHDLQQGGLMTQLDGYRLTIAEVNRLKLLIGAELKREHYDRADNDATGLGQTVQFAGDKVRDLQQAPGYATLPADRVVRLWRMTFRFEEADYTVFFNCETGRMSFSQGTVSEAVIQHVLENIRTVQARPEA